MIQSQPDPFAPPPPPQPQPGMMRVQLPLTRPFIVYALLVLNIIVFLIEEALGEDPVLEAFGQINQAVAQGEWWRLLTAAFLHGGLLHLAFNMYALYAIGVQFERLYGSMRFLLIYLMAGLGAGVATFLFLPNDTVSVGASGAVFGILGGLAAFFARSGNRFGEVGRRQLTSLVVTAAINLAIGATIPNINNFAHIGGLLTGFLLGWLLAPNWQPAGVTAEGVPYLKDSNPLLPKIPFVLLLLAVMVLILFAVAPRWLPV